MASEAKEIKGVVSRISGSGNAILKTDSGREVNLGPLARDVVGKRVNAIKLTGAWALCIDPSYVTDEYLEEMDSKMRGSSFIDEFRPLTEGSASPDDLGRTVQIEADSTQDHIIYEGGKPLRLHNSKLLKGALSGHKIPVDIVAVRRGVAIGVPALEKLESEIIDPGDVVEMNVQQTSDDNKNTVGYTVDSNLPVYADTVIAQPGVVLRVGVEYVFNTHLHTSQSALPDAVWPAEGDVIYVRLHEVTEGVGYGTSDGLPTVLPGALNCLESIEPFKAKVSEYSDGVLTVDVSELGKTDRPEVGDVVEVTVLHREDKGTLCLTRDVPVWIPGSIPEGVESLKCKIIGVNTSILVGTVARCPDIRSLEHSDKIRLHVTHQDGEDGVGSYKGVPIVIPGGCELVGEKVDVGFVQANDGFIIAGVNVLKRLPKVGGELFISAEDYKSRNGRLCFVDSLPVFLPERSNWPAGNVRLGVKAVTAAGVQVSVDSLPPERRPNVGDEIEIPTSKLTPDDDVILIEQIPVEIPPDLWASKGTLILGVSSVEPYCLRCSVCGLQTGSLPAVGERAEMVVDGTTEEGSRGRISGIPTLVPRGKLKEGDSREVLVVEHTDEFLTAVDIDVDEYDINIDKEMLADYYRALVEAQKAWQENDFELSRECCREAANVIPADSNVAMLFRMDAQRHEILLMGEQIRRSQGVRKSQIAIQEAIDDVNLPDLSVSPLMLDELKAYRFALTGVKNDGSMNAGYLNATVRKMKGARESNNNPWSAIIPHPIVASFLASIQKPRVPAAEVVDKLVTQTPEYWPFLTTSEVSDFV
ncbi:hypothetical protein G3A49_07985 [Haloferax volcanii]|uniref:Uncharacterized protein n=1 Tax=Haloferax volcanii TaxID=2246 RepID=A0A6C0UYM4_HALVO|nr:hypothetical protein [Haloferax alexandrinus]QIB78078.1 hypothetical protein G3A49_07985 [Haloferax alexandrinus]